MKIREIQEKADNLKEQGDAAKRQQVQYQHQVASASVSLSAAYSALDAASETDDEGNPRGDVAAAQARVAAAQASLAVAQNALNAVNRQIQAIDQKKAETIGEIDQYTETEEKNLAVLETMQTKRFGGNANAFLANLVARMNTGQEAKGMLQQSMGQASTARHFIASIIGASTLNSVSNGISGKEESAIPSGPYLSSDSHAEDVETRSDVPVDEKGLFGFGVSGRVKKEFDCSVEELDDSIYSAANDYQSNPEKYNPLIRRGETSDDIEKLKSVINSHEALDDSVFYRRATLKDLGPRLENMQPEQLIGKTYTFNGIMSVGSKERANAENNLSESVMFKVIAPKGTHILDLTSVDYFQEAMLSSPVCCVEDVSKEGNNTTVITVRVCNNEEVELLNMGINKVDLSSCHKDNRVYVKKAVESMFRDHPELRGQLSEIKCGKMSDGVYASYGPTKPDSPFGGVLNINSTYFSDSKLNSDLVEKSKLGWFIPNTSAAAVVKHELGHALHLEMCSLSCGVKNGSIPNVEAYRKTVQQYIDDVHADTIVERACQSLNIEFDSWEFSEQLSKYGGSNYGEAIAEAVSEVKSNKSPRPLASQIYNELVKYKMNLEGGNRQ